MSSERIAAVIVAWNRATILSDTLDALASQSRQLDAVVVVDNASTDTTPELVRSHPAVTRVVTMQANVGGAGGFAAGIAAAVADGADLVWLMDDDTVPHHDALSTLLRARSDYAGEPALLACRADWVDGREHPMNAPRLRPFVSRRLRADAAKVGARSIRTASFVAVLIDARAIREEGLPEADFFLWNDDFEYTGRLLRRRVGIYVSDARVEHRTRVFGNSTADPGPRFVNEVRNKVWTFTRSRAFGPLDTLCFSAATIRRWITMIISSADPEAMLSRFTEGLRLGIRSPRTTTEVLASTPVADEVLALERGAGRA